MGENPTYIRKKYRKKIHVKFAEKGVEKVTFVCLFFAKACIARIFHERLFSSQTMVFTLLELQSRFFGDEPPRFK